MIRNLAQWLAVWAAILLSVAMLGEACASDLSEEYARLDEDKRTHIEVEAKIGLLFTTIIFLPPPTEMGAITTTQRWLLAGGVCMAPGIAKEALDEIEYRGADPMDLAADAAGCALGVSAGAAFGFGVRVGVNSVLVSKEF